MLQHSDSAHGPRAAKSLKDDDLDLETRVELWNAFYRCYVSSFRRYLTDVIARSERMTKLQLQVLVSGLEMFYPKPRGLDPTEIRPMADLLRNVWTEYLKCPADELGSLNLDGISRVQEKAKEYLLSCEWRGALNMIQFCAQNSKNDRIDALFKEWCDAALESGKSPYRFVGNLVAPISDDLGRAEVEAASEQLTDAISIHLRTAVSLLSNRESPDYRNSIKESISAVEAMCRSVAGAQNATLGDALAILKKTTKVKIHPALISAFSHLYGYTSDTQGIRHALSDGRPNLHRDDAVFMLVSCSAFVNYLRSKAESAGIRLG